MSFSAACFLSKTVLFSPGVMLYLPYEVSEPLERYALRGQGSGPRHLARSLARWSWSWRRRRKQRCGGLLVKLPILSISLYAIEYAYVLCLARSPDAGIIILHGRYLRHIGALMRSGREEEGSECRRPEVPTEYRFSLPLEHAKRYWCVSRLSTTASATLASKETPACIMNQRARINCFSW